MSVNDKLLSHLFELVSTAAGRDLPKLVTGIAAADYFPSGLPGESDRTGLEQAATAIGESLENGRGAITALQLADAVHAYHKQSGSTWCPPIEAALRAASTRASEV